MFILESYLRNRRAKIEAWNEEGRKWVNKKNANSSYSYYGMDDWESKHPYPTVRWGRVANVVIPALIIPLLIGGTLWFVVSGNDGKDSKPNHSTTQKKDNHYKVGDTVQVVFGDYKDSVGVIVRVRDNTAIIKLTHSTLTKAMCDADSGCSQGGGLDDGSLLSISKLDNLVPYKDVK